MLDDPHRTLPAPPESGGTPARRRIGGPLALLASIAAMLLGTSGAPTPLYADYTAMWGWTDATTAIVFGSYAIALLGRSSCSAASPITSGAGRSSSRSSSSRSSR